MNSSVQPLVLPDDVHNRTLLSHLHPAGYQNPTPQGRYNLVVIGGGTAGLVTAAGAAGLGAKVALIERSLLGGDCLNVGCVPSKALIRAARAVAGVRDAGQFGIEIKGNYELDFGAVMERMRALRARIAPVDSVETLTKKGVDVFLGNGRFLDESSVEVEGTKLKFSRAVIATGARASLPPIPGIEDIDVLTNENLFWLTELPKRLAVIGSGPIGSEMAQTFARFGSQVTVYDIAPNFMSREDPDAASLVQQSMARDGVDFRLGVKEMQFLKNGGETHVKVMENGREYSASFDKVLIGVGRIPNIEGLNLQAADVDSNADGVVVSDRLKTSNPRIYACGDVASKYKFTHAADALARIVIGNALFFAAHKASALNIPWATYTDPEIAHVGVYGHMPEGEGFETMQLSFKDLDRAILDSQEDGLIKIHYDRKAAIRGATIVGAHAGEMIGEIVVAMNHKVRLGSLGSDIHPYPTQSEIIKKCGDAYRRTMLTPTISKFLKRLLEWRR
jgi:pyruvate/2-oxoglutarate dehydrogenase complex dihydrolipoamide dehydrogenase (E3) component